MIFSTYQVCLAYIVGFAASIYLIRSQKLFGAGLFWLLYSIAAGFTVLAAVSSNGSQLMVSLIVLTVCVALILVSILKRDTYNESPMPALEKALLLILFTLSSLALVLLVKDEVNSSFVLVESLRAIIGGLALGSVTNAMLLGHWYLVQPGMSRTPMVKICRLCMIAIGACILLWLFEPSMLQVINGEISDGWGGTLSYMWIGSCVTTFVLLVMANLALKEKSYTAVMATTGLLYLAILVANGVELIPRTILS